LESFGTLNWSILATYLVANLVLGYFLGRRIETADDYYLGKRTTPWWIIGISVIATYVSALSFLGGPAWSYDQGISVIAIHLNYPIVVFLVITFFLPFFFNSGVASIYDYQEKRFGSKSRTVIVLIFLVTQALTSAAILYATALVLEFITGMDVTWAIVIMTAVALVYTTMGGITAVLWTDFIQAAILFVGALVICIALVNNLQQPLGETLSMLQQQGKLDALDFSLDPTVVPTVWSGIIAMTLYHTTVYGANQMMVQRTLAAKNIGDAKKSFLLMGFSAFFVYFVFIMLGVLFYSYYGGREFENSNTIILQFAAEYGMPGLLGLLAAAVLAASMSTLDSSFNSMATVTTIDLYQKYVMPGQSQKHYLKASRSFTVVWAIVIIIPAILYASSEGSILETLTKIGSFFVGAKLSMFALGFFSRQTTEKGLLVGVAAGFIGVAWCATQTDIAWPWYCLIGAGINVAVSIPASLMIDGRQRTDSPYSIRGQIVAFKDGKLPESEGGWYRQPGRVDRVSYLLLAFFAASVIFLALFDALVAG